MNNSELASINLLEFFDNASLAWGLAACGLAQISKVIFELVKFRRWRPAVLFETGGMPSSHSALVTGTASGIGLELGFSDPVFALAATIAFIVMYDASGLRKSAGLIAKRVNQLPDENWLEPINSPLKENLGHTRSEVLIGSLLGPAVSLPGIVFLGSPLHLLQITGIISG